MSTTEFHKYMKSVNYELNNTFCSILVMSYTGFIPFFNSMFNIAKQIEFHAENIKIHTDYEIITLPLNDNLKEYLEKKRTRVA